MAVKKSAKTDRMRNLVDSVTHSDNAGTVVHALSGPVADSIPDDGAFLSQDYDVPGAFNLDVETELILELKRKTGENLIEIGKSLIRVKENLEHGQWLTWLAERADFTERGAQRLMRLAREWTNPTALSDLGATKALSLLVLPPEEREVFLAESHTVNGEEKTVSEMTSRELDAAIKARNDAQEALNKTLAERNDLQVRLALAESERDQEREKAAAAQQEHQENFDKVFREKYDLQEKNKGLMAEIAELKAKPADIAVQPVRDEAAIAEAVAAARKEEQAAADKRVAAENKAKQSEAKKRGQAEKDLADARSELEAAQKSVSDMEAKNKELTTQLAQARADAQKNAESAKASDKQAQIAGDADLALFGHIFEEASENIVRLWKLMNKIKEASAENGEKCKAAFAKLYQQIGDQIENGGNA